MYVVTHYFQHITRTTRMVLHNSTRTVKSLIANDTVLECSVLLF